MCLLALKLDEEHCICSTRENSVVVRLFSRQQFDAAYSIQSFKKPYTVSLTVDQDSDLIIRVLCALLYRCDDVGVTTSVQQDLDTFFMSTVCSVVQNCFTSLQHRRASVKIQRWCWTIITEEGVSNIFRGTTYKETAFSSMNNYHSEIHQTITH